MTVWSWFWLIALALLAVTAGALIWRAVHCDAKEGDDPFGFWVFGAITAAGTLGAGACLTATLAAHDNSRNWDKELRRTDPIQCAATYTDGRMGDANNSSGNICRVKVGDEWCAVVLPDGGKTAKYKPDYVTCPPDHGEVAK